MADPYSLQDTIKKRYGDDGAAFLRRFFENTALPMPDMRDVFQKGERTDVLTVFINRSGCTVRMVDDRRWPLIPHELILQPIASRREGRLRIDIYPGVNPHSSKDEARRVKNRLSRDQISFIDDNEYNCGTLPCVPGLVDGGHPVVFDIDAVQNAGGSFLWRIFGAANQKTPQIHLADTAQKRLYGQLTDAFDRAWPENATAVDPVKMRAFWDACASSEYRSRLKADWMTVTVGDAPPEVNFVPRLRYAAEQYNRKLEAAPL
jgi:hypothetical protein